MSWRALSAASSVLRPAARGLRFARGLVVLLNLLLLTTAALMTRLALMWDHWPLGALALLFVALAVFAGRALGAELDRRAARLVAAGHTLECVPERPAHLFYRGARSAEGALAWLDDGASRRVVLLYATSLELPACGLTAARLWEDPTTPDPIVLQLVATRRWLLACPLNAAETAAQLYRWQRLLFVLFAPALAVAGGMSGWHAPLTPSGRVALSCGGAVLGALLAYGLAAGAREHARRRLARG